MLATNICEVNPAEVFTVTKGILPNLAARLRSLKKRHQGPNSQEERWKEIYGILFPEEEMPSPRTNYILFLLILIITLP
jgi:hypothetical protein